MADNLNLNEAYIDGRVSNQRGFLETDCPHATSDVTDLCDAWRRGWRDMEGERKESARRAADLVTRSLPNTTADEVRRLLAEADRGGPMTPMFAPASPRPPTVRELAAVAVLPVLLGVKIKGGDLYFSDYPIESANGLAKAAVLYADALVAALNPLQQLPRPDGSGTTGGSERGRAGA